MLRSPTDVRFSRPQPPADGAFQARPAWRLLCPRSALGSRHAADTAQQTAGRRVRDPWRNFRDVALASRHPPAKSRGGRTHGGVRGAAPALTWHERRLRGRLLQEDHVLQQGAVRRPAVPLQGRRAQVGGEVGAREERQPLLQAGESQALGFLLAGRPLGGHSR